MASSPYDHVFVYPDPSLLSLWFPLHQETDIGAALPLWAETPAYPSIATPNICYLARPVTARLYYEQLSEENTRSARHVAAENGCSISSKL